MNEPYFCDHHLLLDRLPDVGGTARSAEHAQQRAASTCKNLLLETMTSFVVPASGEACTTKVQLSANYGWYSFQVRHCNGPCLAIQISIRATAMRGTFVND